jgi:hypothetical protein
MIIVFIGRTALFGAVASTRLQTLFTSLDFTTVNCLQRKLVSLASNPQPGGPGPYVPLGCLLRLAGLRRSYSNTPPYGDYYYLIIILILEFLEADWKLKRHLVLSYKI